jgi:uncharacterized repeat protein (TIGR01451 family)
MLMKILRMPVSVFSLILASAVPGSAQTSVFVDGDMSFKVTWQGPALGGGPPLSAEATFTVSEFSDTSFVMTVTNVANTMPTSPSNNGRLTAFGFGLIPLGTFSNEVPGTIYSWAFTNFPAFQRVDVCLTSGSGCAGGGFGGLNQGQSTSDSHSVTISGAFTGGVTIAPIPAKFQTAAGSFETDGVVIDPPQPGPGNLSITKTHSPSIAIPGEMVTYTVTVTNVGSSPSTGLVIVTETLPPGMTLTTLSGGGWTCTVATQTCTRSDPLPPGVSYSSITVTVSVNPGAAPGTVTNVAGVSGTFDPDTTNNTASDPTIITSPDLTLTKTQTEGGVVMAGQLITFTLRVTNVGNSPTNGTVTVTEEPPPGLTVTALSGPGWTCTVPTRTCTRSDELAPTMTYPDITVTARLAPDAVGTIANRAVVSGGGDSNPGNSTGSSPVTVGPLPVPVLPLSFGIGLMSALLAIALSALRARRFRSGETNPTLPN